MRISIGKSRKDIHWKVVNMSWDELCDRLSSTFRTKETVAEYKAMNKDERANAKDVGGFVGGVIDGGRRVRGSVKSRSLVTLDADYADASALDTALVLFDYTFCCYSTHSHQAKAPRLRYVLPLDREVTAEEYEPIARRVAAMLGIDQFDVTTYETNRLMFWPSSPTDAEYIFKRSDSERLCADDILATYADWHDTSEWPLGSSEVTVRRKQTKAQGAPEEKPGMIGVFCRTYDIRSAIDTFLSDVYSPCDMPDRYTFVNGSTTGGLVIYDDRFAYSHHATDPACGMLCNAFDLVRCHKFGDLDYEVPTDTPVNKLPSYRAMCEFVQADEAAKQTIIGENLSGAQKAFEMPAEDEELEWAHLLTLDSKGRIDATTENLRVILENDPNIKGTMGFNSFTSRPCLRADLPWKKCKDRANGTPWEDSDDAGLRLYIETTYGIYTPNKLSDAWSAVMHSHEFHPVRDYLNSLKWDGVQRVEKLFVYYLGAEDTEYTRAVTRKWFVGAVARAMIPGVKFDNMIVLVGNQGIGKSFLGAKLGRSWYSDTLFTVQGKDAYDQLKGSWIIEMSELSAMKKAEVESTKMFISKQEDTYRAAYNRHTQAFKRQCVFYGTTNDDAFLRDYTGNRRFWPIGCDKANALYDVFDITTEDVDQVWAEATALFNKGETLYLTAAQSQLATEEQSKYVADDPRIAEIAEYLDMPLPSNWKDLDKTARRNYVQGYTKLDDSDGGILRDSVSVAEIAYELYGIEHLPAFQSRDLHMVMRSVEGWTKSKSKRKRTVYGRQITYERTE